MTDNFEPDPLDRAERVVVNARKQNVSWWKLAARYGVSERTVQRWHEQALKKQEAKP